MPDDLVTKVGLENVLRQTQAELIYVLADQLMVDPDNPRQFYAAEDVQAMADSILEAGGVDQALLVIPEEALPDGRPAYRVLDGHMRLVAGLSLGDACPPLKCEVRAPLGRREKLLLMARTSSLWFMKDAISEALHYRKLIDDEGMTRGELARQIGKSSSMIAGRLRLLELDPEIQDLVARRELTKDDRIVDAFLSIGDVSARLKLAQTLARRKASVQAVLKACERLSTAIGARQQHERLKDARRSGKAPSVMIAAERQGGRLPDDRRPAAWAEIRAAAREECRACDVKLGALQHVPEPAWSLMTHAAGDVCEVCGLSQWQGACNGCPLPEFLLRVVRSSEHQVANGR